LKKFPYFSEADSVTFLVLQILRSVVSRGCEISEGTDCRWMTDVAACYCFHMMSVQIWILFVPFLSSRGVSFEAVSTLKGK
jgi:hypothetical protein